jgi:hypothetical protein
MNILAVILITLSLACFKPVDMTLARFERNMPIGLNATECVFVPETKLFSCKGVPGVVECPSIFEWVSQPKYHIFGIGFIPELKNIKSEFVRFWLYPRSIDNIRFFNHSLIIEGELANLFLYYSDVKMVENGFRVTDLSCFARLIRLFKISSVERMCELDSPMTPKPKVLMFGEVLVQDNIVSKR